MFKGTFAVPLCPRVCHPNVVGNSMVIRCFDRPSARRLPYGLQSGSFDPTCSSLGRGSTWDAVFTCPPRCRECLILCTFIVGPFLNLHLLSSFVALLLHFDSLCANRHLGGCDRRLRRSLG